MRECCQTKTLNFLIELWINVIQKGKSIDLDRNTN